MVERDRPIDGPRPGHRRTSRSCSTATRSIRAGTTWPTRCLGCTNCTLACPTCFCSTRRGRRATLDGPDGGALAALGLVLHAGPLVPPRRQRPRVHQVPLPAVADPQGRELDRSVRHLGLRRLRALHHLVPGRHRHHRRGGGDPRRPMARRRAARQRSELTGDASRPPSTSTPVRARAAPPSAAEGRVACFVARACSTFRAGSFVFREGAAADALFLIRGGRVALEQHDPRAGAPSSSRRCGPATSSGLSWLFRRSAGRWTRGRSSPPRRSRSTRACVQATRCRRTRPSAWPSPSSSIISSTSASSASACSGSTSTDRAMNPARSPPTGPLVPVPVRVRAVAARSADVVTLTLEGASPRGAVRRPASSTCCTRSAWARCRSR